MIILALIALIVLTCFWACSRTKQGKAIFFYNWWEALAVYIVVSGLLIVLIFHKTNYLMYLAIYNLVMAFVFNIKSPIDALCTGIGRNVMPPILLIIFLISIKSPDGNYKKRFYGFVESLVNGEGIFYNRKLREALGPLNDIDKKFEDLMKMEAEQTTQQHEIPYEDVQLEENERSPYEILEVSEQATMKEIHSAYKRKSLQNHPDRTAGLGEEYRELAEKRMKEINTAYERLRKDNGQA